MKNLEELTFDKEQLEERLKQLVKYKKRKYKTRNGANSSYQISNGSHITDPPTASNSLNTPRLDKFHNKEL